MVHFIHLSLALVPCHAFGCGFVVHGVHIVFHSVNCIVREKKVNWIVACGWIMIIIAIVGQYWIGGEVAIASRRCFCFCVLLLVSANDCRLRV